ncbi:MAG: hypothetical protein ACOCX9_07965, partial [Spirochaetota bacterium]
YLHSFIFIEILPSIVVTLQWNKLEKNISNMKIQLQLFFTNPYDAHHLLLTYQQNVVHCIHDLLREGNQ